MAEQTIASDQFAPMSDGTALDGWQLAVIAEWHRRHPNPVRLEYNRLTVVCQPRGVYCARCRTPSVLFPADDESAKDNRGYCICPRCSQQKQAHGS